MLFNVHVVKLWTFMRLEEIQRRKYAQNDMTYTEKDHGSDIKM